MPARRSIFIGSALVLILLGALIAALVISNQALPAAIDTNAINWRTFTRAEKDTLIADGSIVLMFGKPGYHAGADFAAQTFDHPEIQRMFHGDVFVPMILEYDDWDGAEISAIFHEFGHTKHPIALLFAPDRSTMATSVQ